MQLVDLAFAASSRKHPRQIVLLLVGKLGIVDGDVVAISNLHRQVAHCEDRVGDNKAMSLRRACLAVRSAADIKAYPQRLKDSCLHGRLLIYDALDTVQPCRTLRIKRRQGCNHCNQAPAYGEVQTCPIPAHAAQNGNDFCISPTTLRGRLTSNAPNVIIDVRQCPHFMVAHLAGAINWPLTELLRLGAQELQQRAQDLVTQSPPDKDTTVLVVCVCRRGNDSLVATKRLRDIGVQAWNLHGGLQALAALGQHPWSQQTLS